MMVGCLSSAGGSVVYLSFLVVTEMCVCVCVSICVSPQLWAQQEGVLAAPHPEPNSDETQNMLWALTRRRALMHAQLPSQEVK